LEASLLAIRDTHAGIPRPLLTQWLQIESAIGASKFESALDLLNQYAA
jgi:hypothetical protein